VVEEHGDNGERAQPIKAGQVGQPHVSGLNLMSEATFVQRLSGKFLAPPGFKLSYMHRRSRIKGIGGY
jgi:hypothetical protein